MRIADDPHANRCLPGHKHRYGLHRTVETRHPCRRRSGGTTGAVMSVHAEALTGAEITGTVAREALASRLRHAPHAPRVVLSALLHGAVLAAILVVLRTAVLPPGIPEQVPIHMVFEAPAAAPVAAPAPAPAAAPAPAPTPPPTPQVKPPPPPQPAVVPPVPVPPPPVTKPSPPLPQPPPPEAAPSDTAIELRLPVPPPRPPPPPLRRAVAAEASRALAPSPTAATPRVASVPAQTEAAASAAGGTTAATFEPPRPVAGMASDRPPTYPEIARLRGEQGRTVLRVSVGADGLPNAISVAVSSGYPMLDSAALSAVRDWRFVPATRGNTPVPAVAEVPVRFRLENP
jgi:periplasmic protein TonB